MWARNLLFIVVVLAGIATLTAALFPSQRPPRVPHFNPREAQDPDFRASVDQVNEEFRKEWAEAGLKPAPRASDLQIARRLSLALTGTVPSLQEIRQMEAVPADQRLPWRVAELLQDRRFGDYWAERLARAYVGTEDGPFLVYRRRRFVSWLSDELMKDHPYDDLTRNLIAGQGLWTDNPATNFLTVTIEQGAGKNQPDPERLAGRVSRVFLGVRLDCAQCHNHPFEKWKREDFQGLAAFFGQAKLGFTGMHDEGGDYQTLNRKTGAKETVEPRVPFLPELLPAQGTRRRQLADWITNPRNLYFSRATVNRVWALMFGRPLVEPVDSVPTSGSLPPVLHLLADDFVAHHYDLQRLIRVIAATEVFQLDSAA
ncbi:MAG: DUF1549 domain-containing protein, partial [Planctomycetes bacterium]|nr:DUF1549 domain-containing protein [Planctomycetota bacterium]